MDNLINFFTNWTKISSPVSTLTEVKTPLFVILNCILICIGELDDNLHPIGKEVAVLAQCGYTQEVVTDGQGRPGTTKRRQYYDKAVGIPSLGRKKRIIYHV